MSSYYSNNHRPAALTPTSIGQTFKDVTLTSPPEDSISDLSWSPTADYLAVSSWDSKVRIYDVTTRPGGEGKSFIDFEGPVLSCDWSQDGQKVAGAGADKTARLLDLGANGAPAQQVAAHDSPIRVIRFFQLPSANAPMLVTGSWDKTVKYWDLRQSTAAATLNCQNKIYSMDVNDQLQQSPLAHQTRVIRCLSDSSGWAVGSIEGRCGFEYIDPKQSNKKFTFRCHRSEPKNNNVDCFSVNAISFHPLYPSTFTTAGSDGTFHFWDKDAHSKLKAFESVGAPISATAFNKDGKTFAYAISYDWSKGFAHNSPQLINKVMLHPTTDEEVKPKDTRRL